MHIEKYYSSVSINLIISSIESAHHTHLSFSATMTIQETAAAEQFVVVDKKDATNQEDSTEQEPSATNDNDQADAAAAANTIEIPPEIFLKGLTVLSPRQSSKSGKNDAAAADASSSKTSSVVVAVPLPPLRPEEPVASIRSAISEVIGFAHLTKYRLVLEERSTNATTTTTTSSSSTAANGSSRKKNGKNNVGKNLNGNGEMKEWEAENVVSTYTLEGAQIATDKLVQSLKLGRAPELLVGQTATGKEEELVLDDYGDLSPLLEVLEKEGKVGDPIDNKIIIDASNYAFRVVLERYDAASIRDHLVRVRQLLEGNAPHLVTLVGDEVVEVKKEDQKDVKKEDGVNGGEVKEVSFILYVKLCFLALLPQKYFLIRQL